jgi:hypothetical protein
VPLAAGETALGIDVQDREWPRRHERGGSSARACVASHSFAYFANT